VPDVAADADPATGYLVYWNGSARVSGQPSGWQGIGGTSGGAPVWAALIALADTSPACGGLTIGFANPALYRTAGTEYANVFNDVVSGDNDFTGTADGRFAAGPGYDMASGLGTPNAAALAAGLCTNTVRIVNPGTQRSTVHTATSLRLKATDARGAGIRFRAVGLPSGLSLDTVSGRISGAARKTGTSVVTVLARDSEGATSNAKFVWRVGAAPRVATASLAGLARERPLLSFTLAAGRGAPSIAAFHVRLPRGLRFSDGRGIAVKTLHGNGLRFAERILGGGLTITLRHATGALRVVIVYPLIRGGVSGRASAEQIEHRRLLVTLGVVDSDSGSTHLAIRIKPTG
jgi:hypothetical protein